MKFRVGDVCVIQNISAGHKYSNGDECEVIGPLEKRVSEDLKEMYAYRIRLRGENFNRLAEEKYLRLKRPPEDFTPAETEFTDWLRKQVKVAS